MHTSTVLIAGAGIGGLAAALALHARGIETTNLERTASLRPLGVGINLLPHAVRELTALGLGAALRDIAVAPDSLCFYDAGGNLVFREPRGLAAGDAHPQLSVHRGRLQMLLLDAVIDRVGGHAVRTGRRSRASTRTPTACRCAPAQALSPAQHLSAPTVSAPRCVPRCTPDLIR